jgi:hypothetical protein
VEAVVGLGLWPASPESPGVAYSQEFLEWAVYLQLECHVSLHGFCQTVKWKNSLNEMEASFI